MEFFAKNGENLSNIISKMNDFDILYINEGYYKEKIKITKSNITVIGKGDVTIAYDDYYNKIDTNNKEYLTVRTYTVLVLGDNVVFKNITIKNERLDNKIYGQCVALFVLGNNFFAQNVKLIGGQDTLFTGPLPRDLIIRYKDLLPKDELIFKESKQLYLNCYIEGNIDFIFGSATAIFKDSTICSSGEGFISAPSTDKDTKFGFIFDNCKLTNKNVESNSVYLARPWRDYGYSSFINCQIEGNHIKKELFNNWKSERESTSRLSIYNTCDTSSMANFAHTLTDIEYKDTKKLVDETIIEFKQAIEF